MLTKGKFILAPGAWPPKSVGCIALPSMPTAGKAVLLELNPQMAEAAKVEITRQV